MGIQHAHAAQAHYLKDLHVMGPVSSVDTEFTLSIAVEGQMAITNWTRRANELLTLSGLFGNVNGVYFFES